MKAFVKILTLVLTAISLSLVATGCASTLVLADDNFSEREDSEAKLLYPQDYDNDGIPNNKDNCLLIENHWQTDFDHDGVGDACDPIPGPWGKICPGDQDNDGDGVGDACDSCPLVPNYPAFTPKGAPIGTPGPECDTPAECIAPWESGRKKIYLKVDPVVPYHQDVFSADLPRQVWPIFHMKDFAVHKMCEVKIVLIGNQIPYEGLIGVSYSDNRENCNYGSYLRQGKAPKDWLVYDPTEWGFVIKYGERYIHLYFESRNMLVAELTEYETIVCVDN